MDASEAKPREPRQASVTSVGKRVLAWLLVLVALVLGFNAWVRQHNAQQSVAGQDEFLAFLKAVDAADTIEDPLQRCLHYPDLPHSHWHADTTAAYCRMMTYSGISLAQIGALLDQGKVDQIDAALRKTLQDQVSGPQYGVFDQHMRNNFDNATPATRQLVDRWKQLAPKSPFALLASGMQYKAAEDARGEGWGRDLTDQQAGDMHRLLNLAVPDLEQAIKLEPTLMIGYRDLIWAGILVDARDYADGVSQAAFKLDPADFAVRNIMMVAAQPKWGRHFSGESEQRKQDVALVAQNPLLRLSVGQAMSNRVCCESFGDASAAAVADAADYDQGAADLTDLAAVSYDLDQKLTAELYTESLRFRPADEDTVRLWAQLLERMGYANEAVAGVERIARRFPEREDLALRLGQTNAEAGRAQPAERAYLKVLADHPDSEDALAYLGDLYNHGGHQPEKARDIADKLIARDPDSPKGWIVRICYLSDHNLPGADAAIHHFIDQFGDDEQWRSQVKEMRGYLASHPDAGGS